ncbi:hypothetical protein F5Y17DRAFT_462910 [Xylariaceae sp. FL0594]|nr:hypothetical protein F5Y17DRAFT_462910 [Xylariaceae sp. FL0594]
MAHPRHPLYLEPAGFVHQEKSQPPGWTEVQPSDHAAVFDLLAPANIHLRGLEGTAEMQTEECGDCAPKKPTIHWLERTDQAGGTRIPHRLSGEMVQYHQRLQAAGRSAPLTQQKPAFSL